MRTILFLLLFGVSASRAGEARWIRSAAISSDGGQIAFASRGDLWIVPADGGEARPLTSHVGHEAYPVWSPDGRWIAFASDRHGNFDVFLVPTRGGKAKRLTFHSASDQPSAFTADGKRVLFSSRRLDDVAAVLPSSWLPELYSVSVEGGRPRRELTTPALDARPDPAGGRRLLYTDLKGFESPWRKHHVSSVARDIWLFDAAAGTHVKLTSFRGEDRNPVWSPDGKTVYYLSERGGSFNVWARPVDGGEPRPVTKHAPHPVRFLSIARDGTLAYSYNGGLWVVRPGREPRRLKVSITVGERDNPLRRRVFRDGATEFAVSPAEDQVAFVVRGEIFVASIEYGTTKRITRTAGQERSVAWAPDGKTLYYAGERDGSWNLYRTSRKRAGEKYFFNATVLEETPVLVGSGETFQPVVSPDGKQLAYLLDRDEIRVLDLETGKSRRVVPPERNYSYADGDLEFSWSPDSKWLATTILGEGRWTENVGVVDVESGALVDMTQSGYFEGRPEWSADGSALLFLSNRFGRRNHGGWGSDADVLAIDLTRKAHDRARLSEEEFALLKKKEKEEEKAAKKGRRKKAKKGPDEENPDEEKADEGKADEEKADEEQKKVEPVAIEFEGREDRGRRLTLHSAPVGDYALSPDGETIVYWAAVEGKWDLWLNRIRKASTKRLAKVGARRGGSVVFAKEGDAVFFRSAGGRIAKVKLKGDGGEVKGVKDVKYAAEMVIDGPRERAYIFEHVWRQLKEKFYDPGLHGVDWLALKANYRALLPGIADNADFAELLSEMLGELNASHTGARYRPSPEAADGTASLGLYFAGDGYEVAEVLRGGPADRAESRIAPGVVLTHIDGAALGAAPQNPFALLNRKAGKPTLLAFRRRDGTTFEEVVKPIGLGEERNLRYKRWTRGRRELVDRLSKGRLGYVHVRGMNDRSFRHVFQEVLGRNGNREALVVDTRFNGGGNLHDKLVVFLGGRRYSTYQPRGKQRGALGGDPGSRWSRPVAVVQNEGNYSDAHIFPYAFRALGLGKLIGTPVAGTGTGTAVWWERQIDPSIVFGIPQVGFVTPDGRYLENTELRPDVEVYNDPASVARGEDKQLEKAVEVLLAELER